jgi:hypothetical protein
MLVAMSCVARPVSRGMSRRGAGVSALMLAAILAVGATANAQAIAEGQVEGLGYIGGVTDSGGLTLGGGLHYGIQPRLVLAVEAGYLSVDGPNTSGATIDVNVHYLFPTASSNRKFVPYLLGGIGYQRVSVSAGRIDVSASNVGLNVGGGGRLQAGDNWGVRPELKVLIGDDGTNARFSVGFYLQF